MAERANAHPIMSEIREEEIFARWLLDYWEDVNPPTEEMTKKKTEEKVKWKPLKKPDAEHMPVCTTPDCDRRVNDARQQKCSICRLKSSTHKRGNWYGHDYCGY